MILLDIGILAPDRMHAGVAHCAAAGTGRSALTRTDRPHSDLRAIDEGLLVVLMLQRRVHSA